MNPHAALIAEVLKIPEALDSIAVALVEEQAALVVDLRAAAATGETVKAAWIEGRLRALEAVPGILTRFAENAKSHQE